MVCTGIVCPYNNKLVVIDGSLAGVSLAPSNAREGQCAVICEVYNETCRALIARNGDRYRNGRTCLSDFLCDVPANSAGRNRSDFLCVNNNSTVDLCNGQGIAIGIDNIERLEGDRILAGRDRSGEVQIENNCIIGSSLVCTGIVCPYNNKLVVIDGSLAGVSLAPSNAREGQCAVICEVYNETCRALIARNGDRYRNSCACLSDFLCNDPANAAGRNHSRCGGRGFSRGCGGRGLSRGRGGRGLSSGRSSRRSRLRGGSRRSGGLDSFSNNHLSVLEYERRIRHNVNAFLVTNNVRGRVIHHTANILACLSCIQREVGHDGTIFSIEIQTIGRTPNIVIGLRIPFNTCTISGAHLSADKGQRAEIKAQLHGGRTRIIPNTQAQSKVGVRSNGTDIIGLFRIPSIVHILRDKGEGHSFFAIRGRNGIIRLQHRL